MNDPLDNLLDARLRDETPYIDDAGFTARFKAQQGGVFAQDKEVLEAQQKAIALNTDLKLTAYRIDEGGTRSRQIIARVIKDGARVLQKDTA